MFMVLGVHSEVNKRESAKQIIDSSLQGSSNAFNFFDGAFYDDLIGLVFHFHVNLKK